MNTNKSSSNLARFGKTIKWTTIAGVIIFAGLYYYVALPPINIHSSGTWSFIFLIIAVVLVVLMFRKRNMKPAEIKKEFKKNGPIKYVFWLLAASVIVFIIGSILSSPIVNAKKYQELMTVQEGNFTEDITELSFDKIPLLDRDTAELLGDRKMGSMVDMVSQFEADSIYSQINYADNPVRVTPLKYASAIKWMTNFGDGIPAYIRINMATQNTELVKLSEGMRYTQADHFGRNIYRYLRFAHPTYIYGELSFEIDEEGVPYYVAPVKKFNIGLFGGETIGRVVLCNAITGELEDYPIEDVPQWIDRAYSADLLMKLFDYYGTLKHGFFNSIFSQRDCLETTSGYNYLAIDDDVWMYTGVTSVNGDQSNVGFVLSNLRTMETRYYTCEGATETSAMSSAEGQVQDLAYTATFPLLLNISGEPTYFLVLKDAAGLVKKYAMVNVQKYQVVGIGDSVNACRQNYLELMLSSGDMVIAEDTREVKTARGIVETAAGVVLGGNTHYYIMLANSDAIYDFPVMDFPEIVGIKEGDSVTIEYKEGGSVSTAVSITEK
ncbi:MAG: CvpA family protein [Lachnospiraceae bacterium]|jgi:hypothetical protein|nr:CvpA family protein [Lachnospiraceae bacterium]